MISCQVHARGEYSMAVCAAVAWGLESKSMGTHWGKTPASVLQCRVHSEGCCWSSKTLFAILIGTLLIAVNYL